MFYPKQLGCIYEEIQFNKLEVLNLDLLLAFVNSLCMMDEFWPYASVVVSMIATSQVVEFLLTLLLLL